MGMLFIDRNGLELLFVVWLVCFVVNMDLNCLFVDICFSLQVIVYEFINVCRYVILEVFCFLFFINDKNGIFRGIVDENVIYILLMSKINGVLVF